jgi:replicative DNA helicase
MMNEKLPPHDVAAEEAVVGSLIIDGEAMFEVATFLGKEDFFTQQNKDIYNACQALFDRHDGINQVTVAQELARCEKLDEIGGAAYLSYLVSSVPTSLHIEYFAKIVYRLSIMRRLISASHQIAAIGYEAGPDEDESISKAEDLLFRVKQRRVQGDFVPLSNILRRYFEEIEPVDTEAKKELPHVITGFHALDELLVGLQRSALVILAARPSVGKTSLALNIARNAAVDQKACVAIFSMEMSQQEIVQRLLSSEADINLKRVRMADFTEDEERRIMDASGFLSSAPIYVDDSPVMRVVEIRSKARRLHFEKKVDLVVIDYLQLIKGEGRIENRVQEISEITRSLKALARELDVPVLVVSQLSRALEQRLSHKPQLSDLRDSGSIEQDADVVMFIHREEVYYKTEEDWIKHSSEPYPKGIADIIVAKNRNGPTDDLKLQFINKTTKFKNLESATGRISN